MSYNITVEGGTTVKLPTAGKYCDRDILVTAEGGGLALDVVTASALPDTVVDGQIVVITDTAAGTVYIDTDEPASPASGDVWIEVAAGGDAALELTEESPYLRNGMTEANQWDGSAWEPLDGYIGNSGAWVQFAEALPPIGTALNDCEWDQISKIAKSGKAADYFAIGDTKKITISGTVGNTTFSNAELWAFIIGIYHEPEREGGQFITFQIGKSAQAQGTQLCFVDEKLTTATSDPGYFIMNISANNKTGWEYSTMRTALLGNNSVPTNPLANSLIAALPSDLRAVMKGATKYSDNTGGYASTGNTNVTTTTDYLWLLSEYEAFGSRKYANVEEQDYQKQYDYYKSGNTKLFYRHTTQTTVASWWLRSTYANGSNGFCAVYTDGEKNAHDANKSFGVAPCFCV